MKISRYICLIAALMFFCPAFTIAQGNTSTETVSSSSAATGNPPATTQQNERNKTPEQMNPDLNAVTGVLIVILVLSVVFEVAMTPIFNWRIFLKYGEGKGWKTPIVIGTGLIVFWSYDIDIIRDLMNSLGQTKDISRGGQLLTALLIAGGSDGVFRIFTKFNIRNPVERKEKAALVRAEEKKKKEDEAIESQGGSGQ
ncbi:MAG: hypothetical protein D3904_06525 [Candidatus Electrothrix sp. EH2]|nr:hypothetical protein [Candidatus Electrothrix sp. EH2]